MIPPPQWQVSITGTEEHLVHHVTSRVVTTWCDVELTYTDSRNAYGYGQRCNNCLTTLDVYAAAVKEKT